MISYLPYVYIRFEHWGWGNGRGKGGVPGGYFLENTYCTTNDPSQRVPCSIVKLVETLAVPVNGHVVGGAVVEPERERNTILSFPNQSHTMPVLSSGDSSSYVQGNR